METESGDANWRIILELPRFKGVLMKDNLICTGRFGNVYSYEEAGESFAVKCISFSRRLEDHKAPPNVENINLLMSLEHENLVKLRRVERDNQQIYLIQDFLEGGNLQDLISKAPNQYLVEEQAKSFTVQVLRALEYLHAQRIIHRDVNPGSLLLDKTHTVMKLTNCSICSYLAALGVANYSLKSAVHYMAPEVVKSDKHSAKSDVWSLGATIVEMLTGKPPFSQYENETTILTEIVKCEQSKAALDYGLTERSDLSMEVKGLLESIFQPATVRPSASELLSLDYFRSDYNGSSGSDEWEARHYEYSISKPKGRHLIINNQNYKNMGTRLGSNVDEDRLRSVFESIGFPASVVRDLSGQSVKQCIEEFVNDASNECTSCTIISILAHGEEGTLFGIEDDVVSLSEIYEALSAKNAPKLAGKPKFLIVQACRGARHEEHVQPTDKSPTAPAEDHSNLTHSTPDSRAGAANCKKRVPLLRDSSVIFDGLPAASVPEQRAVSQNFHPHGLSSSFDEDFDTDEQYASTPSRGDILVAYSTTSGYVSWRNQKTGSYFIQALCNVVEKNWRSKHVLDMLTMATSRVASIVYASLRENCTQVPQFESTLRKMFFLSTAEERSETKDRRRDSVFAMKQ